MEIKDLTPEQQQRARDCKSAEELLAFAKEEGYELSESDLEAISGGWDACNVVEDCYTALHA